MDNISKLLLGGGALAYYHHNFASADAKLRYKAHTETLDYNRINDYEKRRIESDKNSLEWELRNRELEYNEEQARLDRAEARYQAEMNRYHQVEMQRQEHRMREAELEVQRENTETQKYIAELNVDTLNKNAALDREASLSMHNKELDQIRDLHADELNLMEQLELARLRVNRKIADQENMMKAYFFNQGYKNTSEIERFKTLAFRETQIIISRENAVNSLNNTFIQQALDDFPLNISPLVLLKNFNECLKNLSRYSTKNPSSVPSIETVYNDVIEYKKNPDPLNIFIAPIYVSSTIKNRDLLSMQIWDMVYHKVESFFIRNYNRGGERPVIFYPTAWKDKTLAGQHTSETLHFFLKDIACLVIEPRFDEHSLTVMLSGWNNGYLTNDHIRVEMNFELNINAEIVTAVYHRSKASLGIISELGEEIDDNLLKKKRELENNIKYYEKLNLKEKINKKDLKDIEALGIYDLFSIDPSKDLSGLADKIASIICANLAILVDIHHLLVTEANPFFPTLFESQFPKLYELPELRDQIFKCYERALIFMMYQDSSIITESKKRELERVKELQIDNIRKQLGLYSGKEKPTGIEDRLREYAKEKYNLYDLSIDDLWKEMLDKMNTTDVPFFIDLLREIKDRHLYKLIDKKIKSLQKDDFGI